MFHELCGVKSPDSVHKPQPLWRKGRAEAESSWGPSAYLPNASSLGQTGSPKVPHGRQWSSVLLKSYNCGCHYYRVPGEIKKRESRGGRWSWTLKLALKRSWAGRWSWAAKWDFFRFKLFLNSSATDIVFVTPPSTAVETAIARCTSRSTMAMGHRLNTSIVLAAVHGLSGLFRAVSA